MPVEIHLAIALPKRPRVIVQVHGFDRNPMTGELRGHPAYAASRYNNLIDGYAVISTYPESAPAAQARMRIEKLNAEGR